MWQAIGFVVVELLKLVFARFLEPQKASMHRGNVYPPVDGDALLRELERSSLRLSKAVANSQNRLAAAGSAIGEVYL